jgi:hypothetical protein
VQAGEADEGAGEALGALEHLAEVESGRVVRRLGEVRELLAGTGAACAQETVEALTEFTR